MTHTLSSYYHGCRCPVCVDAYRTYNRNKKRTYRALKRAGYVHRVDPAETREHIAKLLACGQTLSSVAALSGVSTQHVWALHHGRTSSVRTGTADRLLAIAMTDVPDGSKSDHFVPAAKAQRLVHEIQRSGISQSRIAAMFRHTSGDLGFMSKGHPWVRLSTYRRVLTVYRLLARQGRVPASVLEEVVS